MGLCYDPSWTHGGDAGLFLLYWADGGVLTAELVSAHCFPPSLSLQVTLQHFSNSTFHEINQLLNHLCLWERGNSRAGSLHEKRLFTGVPEMSQPEQTCASEEEMTSHLLQDVCVVAGEEVM